MALENEGRGTDWRYNFQAYSKRWCSEPQDLMKSTEKCVQVKERCLRLSPATACRVQKDEEALATDRPEKKNENTEVCFQMNKSSV